jgi:hypothetical protein
MVRFIRRHRFGILVTALAGYLLAYSGLSSCICFRNKVSEYNYYLIGYGMTEAEVEAILGPGHKYSEGNFEWESDECFILILFDEDGKVIEKSFISRMPRPPRFPRR